MPEKLIIDETVRRSSAPSGNPVDRLRRLALDRGMLDVAQFQFVGLDDIRSAYGERWPGQKARIEEIAARFLNSRMDASDILISGGGGFIVVFGSAVGAEAEAITGQLSHGLNEFFLGNAEEQPAPRFSAASYSVPAADLEKVICDAPIVTPELDPQAERSFSLSDLEWRYQPVWDVRRETLSNWYVSPYLKKTQKRMPGYQFESTAMQAGHFAAVDEASLLVSEQAIEALIRQGKQALVGVSIHARTLTNLAARSQILGHLDRLDRGLCRYRVVKIAGIAPGFPRLYLNEIVQLLKSRGGNVVIGATWDEPDMAGLIDARPVALGVTLPISVTGLSPSVPFHDLMLKLSRDIQRAHTAKVRFFVEGQILQATAIKLAAAGVDNISSPLIWPATGTPDAMLRWPAKLLTA